MLIIEIRDNFLSKMFNVCLEKSHNQPEMTSLSLSATDYCVLVVAAEVIKFAF